MSPIKLRHDLAQYLGLHFSLPKILNGTIDNIYVHTSSGFSNIFATCFTKDVRPAASRYGAKTISVHYLVCVVWWGAGIIQEAVVQYIHYEIVIAQRQRKYRWHGHQPDENIFQYDDYRGAWEQYNAILLSVCCSQPANTIFLVTGLHHKYFIIEDVIDWNLMLTVNIYIVKFTLHTWAGCVRPDLHYYYVLRKEQRKHTIITDEKETFRGRL